MDRKQSNPAEDITILTHAANVHGHTKKESRPKDKLEKVCIGKKAKLLSPHNHWPFLFLSSSASLLLSAGPKQILTTNAAASDMPISNRQRIFMFVSSFFLILAFARN